MGSKAIPALVPAAAFPRIGADDHALGMVQLLRAFSDCVAIIRFWAASDLGAVSLSRNGAAYYFVAHVIAPSSRISAIGISCGCRLRRNWWRNSLVWRATIISAAGDADGTVHLPEHSIFYGAVFFGDRGLRGNLQPLDRRSGSRMVGSCGWLAIRGCARMAADQRARHFRPALIEMDMVLHHNGWGGRARDGVGRTEPARRSE